MTSASRGSAVPGGTKSNSTFASSRSGSKSSELAILDNIGTAIFNFLTAESFDSSPIGALTIESSCGSLRADSSHGITPLQGQEVRCSISRLPSSNKATSPRNLLMMKLRISAASLSSSTALVPTTDAITPPRSISASKQTGIRT